MFSSSYSNAEEIEIRFYNEFLPALVDFAKKEIYDNENISKSLERMIPRFYSGDYCLKEDERGFYLILEDISDQYDLLRGREDVFFSEIKDVLVKMAIFHSVAFTFNLKNPNTVRKWNLKPWSDKALTKPRYVNLMEKCFELFQNENDTNPSLINVATTLKNTWNNKVFNKTRNDERFISHGDLWRNNIMQGYM